MTDDQNKFLRKAHFQENNPPFNVFWRHNFTSFSKTPKDVRLKKKKCITWNNTHSKIMAILTRTWVIEFNSNEHGDVAVSKLSLPLWSNNLHWVKNSHKTFKWEIWCQGQENPTLKPVNYIFSHKFMHTVLWTVLCYLCIVFSGTSCSSTNR